MSEKEIGVQQSLLAVSGELTSVCERAGQRAHSGIEHQLGTLRPV